MKKNISIPLYNNTPGGLIQLDDMEKIVLARLELLEAFETNDKNYQGIILNKEEFLSSPIELEKNPQNDLVSHFILCVANCKTDQTRLSYIII